MKLILGFRSANVNQGCGRQFTPQDLQEGFSRCGSKGIDRLIDDDPARFVEQQARESEALLFWIG